MAEDAGDKAQPAWKQTMAWLPHSIAEAALSAGDGEAPDLSEAWAHLQERLSAAEQLVRSTPVNKNRLDYGSGMRHLMVLLAVGTDMALRGRSRPGSRGQPGHAWTTSSPGGWNARTACT